MAYLTQFDIPCAPVLSMKEISLDPSLRQSGSVVEVEQPLRGKYLTVGCPMKFSAFTPDIKAAPLLGEHTAAVLQELGYSDDEIAAMSKTTPSDINGGFWLPIYKNFEVINHVRSTSNDRWYAYHR